MTEQGVVVAVNKEKATVAFERTSACGKCGLCMSMGERNVQVDLDNPVGAKEGDLVEVSLPQGAMLKSALWLYGLPLLGLFAGAGIGVFVGSIKGTGDGQVVMGLCALSGAALTYGVIAAFERRRKNKNRPVITRVVAP